ncbi:unnamed protein product [Cyprideis torosa]|uniref:Uncharacterized protein n=1 Tax=Cyprideis torosa TaxID=163714 RepID=A0A7R8W343_9CRUS|nr:unnamed protein product [Cyprideis torosa]CAG0882646.1 unnamed protein product [Cyprideis torosa]
MKRSASVPGNPDVVESAGESPVKRRPFERITENETPECDTKGKATCPVDHSSFQFTLIDKVIDANIDVVWEALFNRNSDFWQEIDERRGTKDVNCTPWAEDAHKGLGLHRTIVTSTKIDHAMMSGWSYNTDHQVTAMMSGWSYNTDHQHLLPCSKQNEGYFTLHSCKVKGPPYTDRFINDQHWCLTAIEAQKTRVEIFLSFTFIKSIWNPLKRFVENSGRNIQMAFYHQLLEELNTKIGNDGAEEDFSHEAQVPERIEEEEETEEGMSFRRRRPSLLRPAPRASQRIRRLHSHVDQHVAPSSRSRKFLAMLVILNIATLLGIGYKLFHIEDKVQLMEEVWYGANDHSLHQNRQVLSTKDASKLIDILKDHQEDLERKIQALQDILQQYKTSPRSLPSTVQQMKRVNPTDSSRKSNLKPSGFHPNVPLQLQKQLDEKPTQIPKKIPLAFEPSDPIRKISTEDCGTETTATCPIDHSSYSWELVDAVFEAPVDVIWQEFYCNRLSKFWRDFDDRRGTTGQAYFIKNTCHTRGPMYTNRFQTEQHYCLTALGPAKSRIEAFSRIRYYNDSPPMYPIRHFIEVNARKDMTRHAESLFREFQCFVREAQETTEDDVTETSNNEEELTKQRRKSSLRSLGSRKYRKPSLHAKSELTPRGTSLQRILVAFNVILACGVGLQYFFMSAKTSQLEVLCEAQAHLKSETGPLLSPPSQDMLRTVIHVLQLQIQALQKTLDSPSTYHRPSNHSLQKPDGVQPNINRRQPPQRSLCFRKNQHLLAP